MRQRGRCARLRACASRGEGRPRGQELCIRLLCSDFRQVSFEDSRAGGGQSGRAFKRVCRQVEAEGAVANGVLDVEGLDILYDGADSGPDDVPELVLPGAELLCGDVDENVLFSEKVIKLILLQHGRVHGSVDLNERAAVDQSLPILVAAQNRHIAEEGDLDIRSAGDVAVVGVIALRGRLHAQRIIYVRTRVDEHVNEVVVVFDEFRFVRTVKNADVLLVEELDDFLDGAALYQLAAAVYQCEIKTRVVAVPGINNFQLFGV